MAESANERTAHRWHLEIVQEGKTALADEILTPDVVIHAREHEFRGLDAAKQIQKTLHAAIPDVKFTHHEALADGDRVAIRWSLTGTHQGDYSGVPASGNPIALSGVDWYHFRDGKISEIWIVQDTASLLRQMGATRLP